MKPIALMSVCIVLTACSAPQSSEETLRQHGYSETYVAGYHDGCPSGKRAGGDVFSQRVQNTSAYAAGGDYRTGWDYGFIQCRNTEARNEAIASAIGAAIASGAGSNHGADGIDARKIMSGIDTSGLENLGQ
ncbi:hypothetical protein [Marivita hallyeonensis]|uniref:Lipoprotein n=1 Tax=Marivita hallyeonensis TaxID=996342 RepID=A0A1M5MZB6_9RHOB|nr:hypothetical protein [Marivita hallyeonensis]SHG82567.1 hypothetical protein SAMN05443551_0711 [Marivita hallyeonensis]